MRPRVWSRSQRLLPTAGAIAVTVAIGLVAAGLALDSAAPPLTGRAQVTDGDTLRLQGQRVRLIGLDAPELDQTCVDAAGREWSCGSKAKGFLADLIKNIDLSCQRTGRDFYRRVLARCTADGQDIGAMIVAAGWAQGDFGYSSQEGEARAGQRGIWSGNFVSPAEWRRNHGTDVPGLWEWIRSWFQ